jgi:hypothetical protein
MSFSAHIYIISQYWILVFHTKAFSQIVVTIYHSRAILSLRKSALQLVTESNTCLKHQLQHHSLRQHQNRPRVHLRRLTSRHAISSDLARTLMSWRSSGSYHRRTLKIAILFNGGPAEERNSPVCHVMLEISSLFLVGFLLHSVMFVAESM